MSTIITTAEDGTVHKFESELEHFTSTDEWIVSTRSAAENTAWDEFQRTGNKTDESVAVYNAWLVDQKIRHSCTYPDGTESFIDYKDIK